ncbi:MAG: protein-methionine-sulfoxide reductase catalytic subunit MsrP [Gammaproteobacteria bacterium]|nr:protein-methionine-sulfoxide reductase catalytic subunit MsrP [Gammaproteobacteria bacterium]
MLIKIHKKSDPLSSEITNESVYKARRDFIRTSSTLALGGLTGLGALTASLDTHAVTSQDTHPGKKLSNYKEKVRTVDEPLTPFKDVTHYNNFYEFSTDKEEPAIVARDFNPHPWSIKVEGEVAKPGTYQLEDFIKPHTLEERIYRFRCVEAWSMVIPWVGIPLASIIKRFEPTSKAKFVEMVTLYDPQRMPGQKRAVLDWPYLEGLRMDEAMHPLTILAVGLYGVELPNQNGAPLRLVVPWKYGFKNIKSIVSLRFTEQEPINTWQATNSREYGFYANVNPEVDHPRWSQARERRIGEFLKRKTLKFNGYEEEVAPLYASMDLRKFF